MDKNAEEFYPERFLDTKIDIQGYNFELLPFGSGRRKCPGSTLAVILTQLVLTQLLHCFNLELPPGMAPDDIDMSEKFGLTAKSKSFKGNRNISLKRGPIISILQRAPPL